MIINYKAKKIKLRVKKIKGFRKYLGLMFKSKESENLLFEFDKEVNVSFHSIFVFFPFLIIWLDSKNRVLDFRIAKPFTFCIGTKKKFRRLVETPLNVRNKKILRFFHSKVSSTGKTS